MRVLVYIDGFNLYYRALKKTPFKWLNLHKLAQDLIDPSDQIVGLKYYTARVSGRSDPDEPKRQEMYLKALRTCPDTSIYYGRFLAKTKFRPLVNPSADGPRFVEVYDTEEKGSDVNLATHLVNDAWLDLYDAALVFSQDTDLIEPVKIVRQTVKKTVGLVWLDGKKPGGNLAGNASFIRQLTHARLSAAQFPDKLMGKNGHMVEKPACWL